MLLNLGQSADWNPANSGNPNTKGYFTPTGGYDAADLGDFYQWGRVADGHQKTGWTKNSSHVNQILPMDGVTTSEVIAYSASPNPTYDANHQVEAGNYYGKFISATSGASNGESDWYYCSSCSSGDRHDNGLWGNASVYSSDRTSDIPLSGWRYQANNPCPTGWRVPNSWNWWDLYRGKGDDTSRESTDYTGTDNAWLSVFPPTNNAIGGTIITSNATGHAGERVFLPAAGSRRYVSGALSNIGTYGNYWGSTYYSASSSSALFFVHNNVTAGNYLAGTRPNGFSVRCVSE
jgi:uncharacterized protein (TIGR02145 family)